MAKSNLTAVAGDIEVLESPIYMVEGEVLAPVLTVSHASLVSAPVTTAAFEGQASTTTVSGSDSASGNVITCKSFTPTANVRGTYVLIFKYVNGNQTEYKKCIVIVALQEDTP